MITKSPEHLKLQKLRVFLFLEWFQLTALDAALQVEHLFLNLGHDSEKFFIFLAAGIIQAPILPMGTGERGTLDIAAHGDDDIYRRKVGEWFMYWVRSISMPCTCFIRRTASGLIREPGSVPAEKLSNTSPASFLPSA